MPGLFGIFFKDPSERQTLKTAFDKMAGLLNFGGYELSTVSGPNYLLGNIGPKIAAPVYRTIRSSGPVACLLAGRVFSIGGKDLDDNYDRAFEYILDCIESRSFEGLGKVNGHYTAALVYEKDHKIKLVTDRFGFFKHFYSIAQENFILFPDFIALDALPFLPRRLDYHCFAKFLRFGFPDDDSTLLQDVKVVPNGCIMSFCNAEGLKIDKYWDWDMPNLPTYQTIDEYADECYHLMCRALRRSLGSGNKTVCISLSGGLDSRFISRAARSCHFDVFTLSYGYSKSHEARLASSVAMTLKTKHFHEEPDEDYILKSNQQALSACDGMLFPQQYMQNGPIKCFFLKIFPSLPVHYSGFYGGGMLDAYYWNLETLKRSDDFHYIHERCIKKLPYSFSKLNIEALFSKDLQTRVLEQNKNFGLTLINSDIHKVRDIGIWNFTDRFFVLTHGRRYLSSALFFRFYTDDILPFFDYDFFDFYLTIPPKFRLNDQLRYKIVLQNMADVASIPYNKTGKPVPGQPLVTFNLMKKLRHEFTYYIGRITCGRLIPSNPYNYVQFAKWTRPLKRASSIRAILTDKRTIERGIFNRKGIDDLFSDFSKGKWTGVTISKLYYIELWLRKYLDMAL